MVVMNRVSRTAAAVCGGAVLVFAVAMGIAGAGDPVSSTMSSVSSVAPTGGNGDGAIPVQPVAGACIIGLNCGCIAHHTCATPHAHPGTTGGPAQHNAPAPQNP
jgi:hypothetical protein